MTRDEMRQLIRSQAELLGPVLYEGMSAAISDADMRSRGMSHERFPHLRPLITRIALRQHLEREGLPSQWKVDGQPFLMGQIKITSVELGLTFRFLKERRRTYPGGVPVAGYNPARQRVWGQPALFDLPRPVTHIDPLHQLLLLWDYTTTRGELGFTLRIVHPVEPGVYGQAVSCDLDLAVETGGSIHTRLEFRGDDEEQDLFEVELDDVEDDGEETDLRGG